MTAVAAAFTGDGPVTDLAGLTAGYSAALVGAAVIAVVGAVVAGHVAAHPGPGTGRGDVGPARLRLRHRGRSPGDADRRISPKRPGGSPPDAGTHHHTPINPRERSMSQQTFQQTFQVTGMTCGHCVSAVEEEVGAIADVTDVTVDLASGRVTVGSDREVTTAEIAAAVDEAGYQLAS